MVLGKRNATRDLSCELRLARFLARLKVFKMVECGSLLCIEQRRVDRTILRTRIYIICKIICGRLGLFMGVTMYADDLLLRGAMQQMLKVIDEYAVQVQAYLYGGKQEEHGQASAPHVGEQGVALGGDSHPPWL